MLTIATIWKIVIASGLSALYAATGSTNTALLNSAEVSMDATIAHLTSGGILKETCDDPTGATKCDADQVGLLSFSLRTIAGLNDASRGLHSSIF